MRRDRSLGYIGTVKGLILAAGLGERLRSEEVPKPLVTVEGVTLIERVIDSVLEGGIESVCVVTGCHGDVVEKQLRKIAGRKTAEIEMLRNADWKKGSASSFVTARTRISEPFLLTMGDHLFDPSPVRRIIDKCLGGMEVVLVVDRRPGVSPDPGEATVALTREERLVAVGKDLTAYNAVDTGIFLCTPPLFTAVAREMDNGMTTMSGGVNRLAAAGRAGAVDLGDVWWIDVDNPADLASARRHFRKEIFRGENVCGDILK